MILVGQYDSFPTRRVAVTLHHYGLPFGRDTRSVFGDAEAIGRINPLTRIPALILDDGEVLIDSAAIIDHLDELAGPRALVPRSGPARRIVLQGVALAQGIAEKAGAVIYERHFHSPPSLSEEWESRCLAQARAGLAEMARRLTGEWVAGAAFSHADLMAACAVGYLRLRAPELLDPVAHRRILAHADRCEALPAFRAAAIAPDETMPANGDEAHRKNSATAPNRNL